MKILQVVQTLDVRTGGVAGAVLALSEALARKGHEVEIASLDAPGATCLEVTALKTHALGSGRGGYGYSPALLPWLRTEGRSFERVIVNGLWQYASFAAWRAFSGTSTPYYVFPHGMLDPWFKRTYPLKHLKKRLYWPWAEYHVLRDARAVIFTSEEERLEARKSFWLYRCTERVSSLGVEDCAPNEAIDREEFLARFPQLREQRILLFLGRLHPKKGCDLLVEAFVRVLASDPKFTLVLAGPDQTECEAQLRSLAGNSSARIVFIGMLEGRLKHGAFAAAEVFVLPSHQENFGLAAVEALAAGVPVLISNKVNIWREVLADAAGLVENDDLAGTIRLLEHWRDATLELRLQMKANARASFVRRFEIRRAADSLLEILTEPARA